jgi:hypothetical protein
MTSMPRPFSEPSNPLKSPDALTLTATVAPWNWSWGNAAARPETSVGSC